MTWGCAFIAELARLLGCASPAFTASCQPESGVISGTAQTMPLKPLREGMPGLERRATVYYNRDQTKVDRYLTLHRLLSNGGCSDAHGRQG